MPDRAPKVRTDPRDREVGGASAAVRAQACAPDAAPAVVGPLARVTGARGEAPARRCSPRSVL